VSRKKPPGERQEAERWGSGMGKKATQARPEHESRKGKAQGAEPAKSIQPQTEKKRLSEGFSKKKKKRSLTVIIR